jgi:hypothetical protein
MKGHVHYWVFGEPAGVVSFGRCECGDVQVARNGLSDDALMRGRSSRPIREARARRLEMQKLNDMGILEAEIDSGSGIWPSSQ